MIMQRVLSKEKLFLIIIIVFTIISNWWILSLRNGFIFDDYSWLNTVKYNTYGDIFNYLPQSKYNDRPVGTVFIKILYDAYGLNFTHHHLWLLILHLINVVLVYSLIKKVLLDLINKCDKKYRYLPVLSALIYGLYPKSLMAVQWDAAIFDLLGALLILIMLNLYVIRNITTKYKVFHFILILIFYYLALRTKEMSLTIPVIIILYECLKILKNNTKLFDIRDSIIKLFQKNYLILILLLMMVSYFMLLNNLPSAGNMTEDISSPYFLSFNPINIIESFLKYILIYFDFRSSEFMFNKLNTINIITIIILAILFILLVFKSIKNNNVGFTFIFVMIVVSFAPVLPLKNVQHVLYLYIPSIFISIFIAYILNELVLKYMKKDILKWISIVLIIICELFLTQTPGIVNARNYWMSVSDNNRKTIDQLYNINRPEQGAIIYVTNVKDSHNVFFYGPGYINNILYGDSTLKTEINPVEIKKDKSYLLLEYNNGDVKELERNSQKKDIILEETFPNKIISGVPFNKQKDGKSAIAVKGVNFTKLTKIIINEQLLETVVSKEGIASAIVPDELFKDIGTLKIQVIDGNQKSNEKIITIE